MTKFFDEYFKIVIYTIFGLIFFMSSYLIVINIHHYKALSQKVVVSEIDVDYKKYKKTIQEIEEVIKKSSYRGSQYTLVMQNTLNILKNDGVYRLMPKTKLSYHDLYILNDYFINDIINNCWVSNLRELNKKEYNEKTVNVLINNANYLNKHFIDNGLTLYDSYNPDKIQEDYYMILNNYSNMADVILSISKGE